MTRREKLAQIIADSISPYKIDPTKVLNAIDEIEKLFKKKEVPTLDAKDELDIEFIVVEFSKHIHPVRLVNDAAKVNILHRLRNWSLAECIKAIQNFSRDDWNMKNNGHRSLEWFFDKDTRIETYLRLIPKGVDGKQEELIVIGNKTYHNEAELLEAEKKGEIVYDEKNSRFVPAKGN